MSIFSQRKELEELRQQVQDLQAEKADMELMFQAITEHADIVEEELIEAREVAEKALKSKADFLAKMSHEIRTPINGVIGATELLLDTSLNVEQNDYTLTIKYSSEILLTLINDILDFSKIEAGQLTLEQAPFILRDCIEQTMDLVALNAHQKQLNLSYCIEPNVPEIMLGDVTRLRQILLNLLSNSLKFTHHGEVWVYVKLLSEQTVKPLTLQFEVRDTGVGIAAEKVQNLFEAFVQADNSITRKYGGTGLGLTISKNLCELMGGKIWVESQLNQGTSFFFTALAEFEPEAAYSYLYQPISELDSKTVLICSSRSSNLRILDTLMQQWGLSTLIFEQINDLQKYVKHNPTCFDLIILECCGDERAFSHTITELNLQVYQLIALIPLTLPPKTLPKQMCCLAMPLKPKKLYETVRNFFTKTSHIHKQVDERPVLPPAIKLKILLAEDNRVNQKIAKIILQKLGYEVDVADNGLEVLLSLEQQRYDVILMDIQMPEMDGLTATKEIIQRYAASRPIIIAMTANAIEGDKEVCLAAGMDDYLSKPINRELLAEKLIHYANQL